MTDYEDMEIICADCEKPFIFEAGEQKFFAEKGFTLPKRCKPCRDARKAKRDGGGGSAPHADDFGDVWSPEDDERKSRGRRRRR